MVTWRTSFSVCISPSPPLSVLTTAALIEGVMLVCIAACTPPHTCQHSALPPQGPTCYITRVPDVTHRKYQHRTFLPAKNVIFVKNKTIKCCTPAPSHTHTPPPTCAVLAAADDQVWVARLCGQLLHPATALTADQQHRPSGRVVQPHITITSTSGQQRLGGVT